ncbi:MAG: lipid A biosynthesis acyltransferase, partial [Epsilonproteobacteria bacterium]|nr:lipid A biosynthesis acyltransferase [Campylobacterota bacterium]
KVAYKFDRKHNHIINANLKLAFEDRLSQEDRDRIGVDTFYNLLQTIVGFMRREGLNREEILKEIEFKNSHIFQNAIDRGDRVVLFTAHYSNWELLPTAVALKFNIELVGVGRKLDSKIMDNLLKERREEHGVEMIYRKGAVKNLIRALKSGKVAGLLLDQHLGERQGGVEVQLFNHKALHSPIASILARGLNAVVIPTFIRSDDYKRYVVEFNSPIDVIKTDDRDGDILKMSQAQADAIEKIIDREPNQWFWVHRRWKGFYPNIYRY